ncbi:hypothetical protein ADUPG1_012520 [Aduncisulcus paluster]|uniref:Kinesin motor domain-containing protein n=1 Tax=Aduncisulcus paluster TaxID=2918883 RepID=A0ABQ5K3F1_9EUKA|nr:hypothetical protein ADUPG1_012520 [Aduncisulcus paluster]
MSRQLQITPTHIFPCVKISPYIGVDGQMDREIDSGCVLSDSQRKLVQLKGFDRSYKVSSIQTPDISNKDFYQQINATSLIERFFKGYSVIFSVFGPHYTGKSHLLGFTHPKYGKYYRKKRIRVGIECGFVVRLIDGIIAKLEQKEDAILSKIRSTPSSSVSSHPKTFSGAGRLSTSLFEVFDDCVFCHDSVEPKKYLLADINDSGFLLRHHFIPVETLDAAIIRYIPFFEQRRKQSTIIHSQTRQSHLVFIIRLIRNDQFPVFMYLTEFCDYTDKNKGVKTFVRSMYTEKAKLANTLWQSPLTSLLARGILPASSLIPHTPLDAVAIGEASSRIFSPSTSTSTSVLSAHTKDTVFIVLVACLGIGPEHKQLNKKVMVLLNALNEKKLSIDEKILQALPSMGRGTPGSAHTPSLKTPTARTPTIRTPLHSVHTAQRPASSVKKDPSTPILNASSTLSTLDSGRVDSPSKRKRNKRTTPRSKKTLSHKPEEEEIPHNASSRSEVGGEIFDSDLPMHPLSPDHPSSKLLKSILGSSQNDHSPSRSKSAMLSSVSSSLMKGISGSPIKKGKKGKKSPSSSTGEGKWGKLRSSLRNKKKGSPSLVTKKDLSAGGDNGTNGTHSDQQTLLLVQLMQEVKSLKHQVDRSKEEEKEEKEKEKEESAQVETVSIQDKQPQQTLDEDQMKEIEDQMKEIEDLKAQIIQLTERVSSLETENSLLREDCSTIDDLRLKCSKAEDHVSSLTIELSSRDRELSLLKSELSTSQHSLQTSDSTIHTLESTLHSLETNISALTLARNAMESERDSSNLRVKEIEASLSQYSTELNASKDLVIQLERDMKRSQSIVEQQKEELKTFESRIAELRKKNDEILRQAIESGRTDERQRELLKTQIEEEFRAQREKEEEERKARKSQEEVERGLRMEVEDAERQARRAKEDQDRKERLEIEENERLLRAKKETEERENRMRVELEERQARHKKEEEERAASLALEKEESDDFCSVSEDGDSLVQKNNALSVELEQLRVSLGRDSRSLERSKEQFEVSKKNFEKAKQAFEKEVTSSTELLDREKEKLSLEKENLSKDLEQFSYSKRTFEDEKRSFNSSQLADSRRMKEKESEMEDRERLISSKEQSIVDKEKEIVEQMEELADKTRELQDREKALAERSHELDEKEKELIDREETKELEYKRLEEEYQAAQMKEKTANKDFISDLQSQLGDLKNAQRNMLTNLGFVLDMPVDTIAAVPSSVRAELDRRVQSAIEEEQMRKSRVFEASSAACSVDARSEEPHSSDSTFAPEGQDQQHIISALRHERDMLFERFSMLVQSLKSKHSHEKLGGPILPSSPQYRMSFDSPVSSGHSPVHSSRRSSIISTVSPGSSRLSNASSASTVFYTDTFYGKKKQIDVTDLLAKYLSQKESIEVMEKEIEELTSALSKMRQMYGSLMEMQVCGIKKKKKFGRAFHWI